MFILNENAAPRSHGLHFKCPLATWGGQPPCWIGQVQKDRQKLGTLSPARGVFASLKTAYTSSIWTRTHARKHTEFLQSGMLQQLSPRASQASLLVDPPLLFRLQPERNVLRWSTHPPPHPWFPPTPLCPLPPQDTPHTGRRVRG